MGPKRLKSPKKDKKPPQNKGKKNKEKNLDRTVHVEPEFEDTNTLHVLYDGIVPLFLTRTTQELLDIVPEDENISTNKTFCVAKSSIIEDIYKRKQISEFYAMKDFIVNNHLEELLIVFDPDYEYGENFFICVTEEAKNRILSTTEEKRGNPFNLPDVVYKAPIAKAWQDLGSGEEVDQERAIMNRKPIQITVNMRRDVSQRTCNFTSQNWSQNKELYAEFASISDRKNVVFLKQLNTGIQAVPETIAKQMETDNAKPISKWTQYTPRVIDEDTKKDLLASTGFRIALKNVAEALENALIENELVNSFVDPWSALGDNQEMPSDSNDLHLEEYHSFQDLKLSRDKQVVCDEWHPTIPGVVAMSCIERISYENRVKGLSQVTKSPSLILIWNCKDFVRPRLLLEAPNDCMVFRFNPVCPNLIVGGCISGRIVLWDITQYESYLTITQDSGKTTVPSFLNKLNDNTVGVVDEEDIPRIQPVAKSGLEHGICTCVRDIQWLCPPYMIDAMGKLKYDSEIREPPLECHQFLSCSGENHFLVWELLNTSNRPPGRISELYTGSELWYHLYRSWLPLTRIFLPDITDGRQYSLSKFCFHYPMYNTERNANDTQHTAHTEAPSDDNKLHDINTSECSLDILAGTFSGEMLAFGLHVRKHPDTNLSTIVDVWSRGFHSEIVRCVQISPHDRSMLLTAGGYRCAVWKISQPSRSDASDQAHWPPRLMLLFQTERNVRVTASVWSCSRVALFFTGADDGLLEAWDILDKSPQQEPLLSQTLSGVRVSSLQSVCAPLEQQKRSVVSVADYNGSLHLLLVPHAAARERHDDVPLLREVADRQLAYEAEVQAMDSAGAVSSSPLLPEGRANVDETAAPQETGPATLEEVKLAVDEGAVMFDDYMSLQNALINELAAETG